MFLFLENNSKISEKLSLKLDSTFLFDLEAAYYKEVNQYKPSETIQKT